MCSYKNAKNKRHKLIHTHLTSATMRDDEKCMEFGIVWKLNHVESTNRARIYLPIDCRW